MTAEKEISIWVKSVLAVLEKESKEKPFLVAERLLAILKKKKKGYLLPQIIKKIERDYSKKNKIDLFLAKDHSRKTLDDLSEKLLGIFGQGKKISVKIEEDLIAGFLAKTDNFLVSASVKDFLNELKTQLIN